MIIQDPNTNGLGRIELTTVPLPGFVEAEYATYTYSGKILLSYRKTGESVPEDYWHIAVLNDDGTEFKNIFSGLIPKHKKANGIRFMVFQDNKRLLLGDYVLECSPGIDRCEKAELVPVEYPWNLEEDENISRHWSEIIIAPDNEHMAWTMLRPDIGAAAAIGSLKREGDRYTIEKAQVISTVEFVKNDPDREGYLIPQVIRGGEVKQFVRGGTAISVVGAKKGSMTNSIVQDLASPDLVQITNTPGYDETTIFSPDERLGMVMSTRSSPKTDPAIFGLLPRPYGFLSQGIIMVLYMYAVAGVRAFRKGNIGPVLVEIDRSVNEEGYQGVALNDPEEDHWVYCSPMSWHPDGKKAMWPEKLRGSDDAGKRIRKAELLDYQSGKPVPAAKTPDSIPYAESGDILKAIPDPSIEGKIAGKHSGYIEYKRQGKKPYQSAMGSIETAYVNYSDDGKTFWNGFEKTNFSYVAGSDYEADVQMTGAEQGEMKFRAAFTGIAGNIAPKLIFDTAGDGKPRSFGYARYKGRTLRIEDMEE
jgi:hypothetical protein